MKIALIGYGRMGKAIEEIAFERGHEIVFKSSKGLPDSSEKIDVAIEFSVPKVAYSNIKWCIDNGIPVVSGTTGWLDRYDEIKDYCNSKNAAILYSSNFSIGVNILFEINKKLASIIGNYDEYSVEIEEIHHLKKLDSPSGTAISLANGIIENTKYNSWKEDLVEDNSIPIFAKREEGVPGTHIVKYNSDIDYISIKHKAHNRKGFAMGAVLAAEFIFDKKGVFSMRDVLFG